GRNCQFCRSSVDRLGGETRQNALHTLLDGGSRERGNLGQERLERRIAPLRRPERVDVGHAPEKQRGCVRGTVKRYDQLAQPGRSQAGRVCLEAPLYYGAELRA